MDDAENIGSKRLWRVVRIVALSIVLVFLVGMVGGFVAGHLEKHGSFSLLGAAILAGIVIALLGSAWLLLRELRKPSGEEPLTRRERLNRNIIVGCGVLGLVMGVAMTLGSGLDLQTGSGVFSNDPLPPLLALGLVAVMGVVLPVLSVFWHRSAVDELEADAYKTGSLYAIYVYMIGAPVWWLLWRGGFVPEPNGIIIYFAVITTLGAVWLRKKHG